MTKTSINDDLIVDEELEAKIARAKHASPPVSSDEPEKINDNEEDIDDLPLDDDDENIKNIEDLESEEIEDGSELSLEDDEDDNEIDEEYDEEYIDGDFEYIEAYDEDDLEDDLEAIDNLENEEQKSTPTVAKSTALMSIATLGSRVTGLIRTWAMAFALGNTFITSAYQVANTLPNAIYDLVAGGLLGAAFIPVYLLQKTERGQSGASSFGSTILNLVIIVLGVLSALCTVFAPAVITTQTFTVSDTASVTRYAVIFFRIFAVQLLFYGIGGVVTGILNAHRVYFLPSLAPALNNIVVIASFFAYIPLSAYNQELALLVLGAGTTAGVVVQFIIQIPALIKCGFKYEFRIRLKDPAIIEAVKIAVPTCIYIVGTLVAFTFRNAFSIYSGENGPATLAYAWMWFQLPYGVIAVSLSRALFTEMSESSAKHDNNALREHIFQGISNTLALIIPLAGLMFLLATPIMQLFQAGAFNSSDVSYVAFILKTWVLSLPFYSVVMFLYNTFASIRKFGRFAAISTAAVVLQIGLYYIFVNMPQFGLVGIPMSDFIYYGLICIVLAILIWKMVGSIKLGSILWIAVRVLAASAIVIAGLYCLQHFVFAFAPAGGMLEGFLNVAIGGMLGLLLIFAICALFQVPIANNVLAGIKSFLHKR